MSENDFTSIDQCQMIGEVVFIEHFLEKMREKFPPHKLKLMINVGRPYSFLECEREDLKSGFLFKQKAEVGFYNASWTFYCACALRSLGIDDSKLHFTQGEVSNFCDIVAHLEVQLGYLEDGIKAEEKKIRLIIDHPKSFFDCQIGEERLTFPVFSSDNGNKIISYPGPYIKLANKRTM